MNKIESKTVPTFWANIYILDSSIEKLIGILVQLKKLKKYVSNL